MPELACTDEQFGIDPTHDKVVDKIMSERQAGGASIPLTTEQCAHGSLKRSCEICERDAEITRLSRHLRETRTLLEEWMIGSDDFDMSGWVRRVRDMLEDSNPFNAADDDDEPVRGVDVCTHGVGFDETCEDCDDASADDVSGVTEVPAGNCMVRLGEPACSAWPACECGKITGLHYTRGCSE